ncbi:MAG: hypothetical protein NT049_00155, partial [Planctomycetota bacterium]|nr:hypothetical protein [Planctomycetota bacterium]
MRWVTGLALGLAVILTGCDNQVAEQTGSEVKTIQTRCEAYKRECDTLKAAVENLRAENTALERKR